MGSGGLVKKADVVKPLTSSRPGGFVAGGWGLNVFPSCCLGEAGTFGDLA